MQAWRWDCTATKCSEWHAGVPFPRKRAITPTLCRKWPSKDQVGTWLMTLNVNEWFMVWYTSASQKLECYIVVLCKKFIFLYYYSKSSIWYILNQFQVKLNMLSPFGFNLIIMASTPLKNSFF